jgi:hypothetical protein
MVGSVPAQAPATPCCLSRMGIVHRNGWRLSFLTVVCTILRHRAVLVRMTVSILPLEVVCTKDASGGKPVPVGIDVCDRGGLRPRFRAERER